MRLFLLLYLLFSINILYANIDFKMFKTYNEAILYIYEESKKSYKKPSKKTSRTSSTNKKYKSSTKNLRTSCKKTRLSMQEFYTPDTLFYKFDNGSEIRYKYSLVEGNKEFFIRFKDFPLVYSGDELLSDKKRFVIKTRFAPSNINKRLTDLENIKRLELGIIKTRKNSMFLVLESNENTNIKKCELFLRERGASKLHQYSNKKASSNKYDFIYKVYLGERQ